MNLFNIVPEYFFKPLTSKYKNNKDLSYKHFGDIDAGGFHIF
jgi:hypothetical protein